MLSLHKGKGSLIKLPLACPWYPEKQSIVHHS